MKQVILVLPVILLACGCESQVRIKGSRGAPTVMEDPKTRGVIAGVGIESQDIVAMADLMVRDILRTKEIVNYPQVPRIVIDSANLRNESSSIINKSLFTDILRGELVRAAAGRLEFLAREHAGMTEQEWMLEEAGVVSQGTQGETKQAYGYDYRLGGRIASLDMADPESGFVSRYHQMTFELVERGSGVIRWSMVHKIKKSAQDDITQR